MSDDSVRKTLSEDVHLWLRNGLISGMFLPQEHLTLRSIAERTGTSITPVREAIHRLAAEGALILEPNKSITVPLRSRDELRNIWRLRVLVEGEACALAAVNASAADMEEIINTQEATKVAIDRHDMPELVRTVSAIGLMIAKSSGSAALMGVVTNLRLLIGPHVAGVLLRAQQEVDPDLRMSDMMDQVIRALQDKDSDQARDLRRADIRLFQAFVERNQV